jgi:hypothetical protein
MINMKGMTEPKESGSMVDTIFKAFEFAQNMGGGGESGGGKEGSNWVDVIRDVIKAAPEAIKPMLEARMAAMQAQRAGTVRQAPATQIPSPVPAAAAPTPSPAASIQTAASVSTAANTSLPQGDAMRAIWEPIAKQHLAKVVTWAERDRDPEIYAEVFVDELPDLSSYFTPAQILEHLNHPQWFAKVCELEPRLQPFDLFCDDMRVAIIEIVKDIEHQMQEETPTPEPDKVIPAAVAPAQSNESFEV